jgi:hypothetical protein
LQKVRFRVVVHHKAAYADLGSQDFDDLARERRLLTIGPAIDEGKIDRTTHAAQRLSRVSLADVDVFGKVATFSGTSSDPMTMPPPLLRIAAAK